MKCALIDCDAFATYPYACCCASHGYRLKNNLDHIKNGSDADFSRTHKVFGGERTMTVLEAEHYSKFVR